jgi:predicted small lipoprotein YifL
MKKVFAAILAASLLTLAGCGFKTCPTYAKQDTTQEVGQDTNI